jgi:hypothetical protein
MEEKEHVLDVLRCTKKALKTKNYVKIKILSGEMVHNSSIHQDPDVISVAVIVYSLSKLIEREHYKEYANWQDFYRNYLKGIDILIKCLEKNNIEEFRKEINYVTKLIESLTGNLKPYIADVFRKARINKASGIYEHGISMENTAKILGISIWELAEYAGQTKISDINLSVTMPIVDRLKIAEEIFEK